MEIIIIIIIIIITIIIKNTITKVSKMLPQHYYKNDKENKLKKKHSFKTTDFKTELRKHKLRERKVNTLTRN